MQRAPDQTKAQTHKCLAWYPGIQCGTKLVGQARPTARSHDVVSKAARTATSVLHCQGKLGQCIRNHHRRNGPAPERQGPQRRGVTSRTAEEDRTQRHSRDGGQATPEGRAKKPSRTLAGPSRDAKTKSRAKVATPPRRTLQAANRLGPQPSPPPRHGSRRHPQVFAPNHGQNQAEPERHPMLANQNQAATGTSPRGQGPTNASACPEDLQGLFHGQRLFRGRTIGVVGQSFRELAGIKPTGSRRSGTSGPLSHPIQVHHTFRGPRRTKRTSAVITQPPPHRAERQEIHRLASLGRGHIVGIGGPNATSLATASTTAVASGHSCTPTPSSPEEDRFVHQAPNARRQDANQWNRIGGQPPPVLDHAAVAGQIQPRGRALRTVSIGTHHQTTNPSGQDFPFRSNSPSCSTPRHSEVHRKRKCWLLGTKPPDATAAPSQLFWWPRCPQVSSP